MKIEIPILLILVSVGVMNIDVSGEEEQHQNLLKQGDFFTFKACSLSYVQCDNFFKYNVWIS